MRSSFMLGRRLPLAGARWVGAVCTGSLLVGMTSWVFAAKEPPPPPLPAPDVRLTIETHAVGELWRMEVTNTGSTPLRLIADARLLRLQIIAPTELATAEPAKGKVAAGAGKFGAKKKEPPPIVCELPASMRSEARVATLPPGGRYIEAFDPRLYCLDASSHLVAGATIVAYLGFAPPKTGKLVPPFVVAPMPMPMPITGSPSSSASATIASAKEIVAPAIILDERLLAKSAAKASPSASTSAASKSVSSVAPSGLIVKAGAGHSVAYGKDLQTTIILTNPGPEARSIYARPQLVSARVRGPHGDLYACPGPNITPAPIADFVTKLPSGASWSTTSLIEDLCPPGTFELPGLYEVTPILRAPPIPKTANAVHGDLGATNPQLVRVEIGNKPFHDTPPLVIKPVIF